MTGPWFAKHVVDTSEGCEALARRLFDETVVGVDTETFGWSPDDDCSPIKAAQIMSIQFATATDAWFIPAWGPHAGLLAAFKSFLEDETPRKVLHNASFDRHVLANAGIAMRGLLADTLAMDYTFRNGDREHGLKPLSEQYFGLDCPDYRKTFREPKPSNSGQYYVPDLRDVVRLIGGTERLTEYAIKDPWLTVLLYQKLRKELDAMPWNTTTFGQNRTQWDYYTTIERPFGELICDIEALGIATDLQGIEALECGLKDDKAKLEADWEFLAPRRSITSNDDIVSLLEPHLTKMTKSGKKFSVAVDVLEGINDPIARLVLEHRKVTKMLGGFVTNLKNSHKLYGGRIHTSFNPWGTLTGRLSSRNPNLQNMPKDKRIRQAFVPGAGYTMGCIDMSQIEVRLSAIMSRDQRLTQAIRDGLDMHSYTATVTHANVASFVRGKTITPALLKEIAETFPDERQEAKSIMFGSIYGMGAGRYAAMTGKSLDEGKRAIKAFWGMYPELKTMGDKVFSIVQKQGYFHSLIGRRIYVDDANHEEEWIRKKAKRQAGNYIIQGAGADLLRLSMVKIAQCPRLRSLGARMILTIHDEVLVEVPCGTEAECRPLIEGYMSNPTTSWGGPPLPLPTPAEIGYGASWSEAK